MQLNRNMADVIHNLMNKEEQLLNLLEEVLGLCDEPHEEECLGCLAAKMASCLSESNQPKK